MAPKPIKYDGPTKEGVLSRGAWTPEEDRKLAQCIEAHGAKRWKAISVKSGLNRCGKSCRLRWLNYLRPNIKRGNISDEEEDLIIRLHKLLGNRWSLIAGRIPGRTDNEIKNYWNSHLCKKINHKDDKPGTSTAQESVTQDHNTGDSAVLEHDDADDVGDSSDVNFDVNEFFNFSTDQENFGFDWMNKYLELDDESTKEGTNEHCVDQ